MNATKLLVMAALALMVPGVAAELQNPGTEAPETPETPTTDDVAPVGTACDNHGTVIMVGSGNEYNCLVQFCEQGTGAGAGAGAGSGSGGSRAGAAAHAGTSCNANQNNQGSGRDPPPPTM